MIQAHSGCDWVGNVIANDFEAIHCFSSIIFVKLGGFWWSDSWEDAPQAADRSRKKTFGFGFRAPPI